MARLRWAVRDGLYALLVALALVLAVVGTLSWPAAAPDGDAGDRGRPRNVDAARLERLLREGRLAEHPAAFWRALDGADHER